MYIVKLDPDLLEVNARIRSAAMLQDVVTAPGLGGTLYNGYNQATAQIAPGTSGNVTVTFEFDVMSVTSATFDLWRTQVQQIVSAATEQAVATAAGIAPQPPPAPASRMASYAGQLFADVVFGGAPVSGQARAFGAGDCASASCRRMLGAIRRLDVTQVSFSGTLTASSDSPATAQVSAYVPVTAVAFDDGLTIPFAGYSDNVLVDDGVLKTLPVPGGFWTAPAA